MGALLTADRVGRRFGPRWIFRRISLELEPGTVLAVTGRNGQGKSTLLKVMAGLLEPTEGAVLRAASVGYAALDLALYPNLTAKEHLDWSAEVQGVPTSAYEDLKRVGLEEAINRPANALSTGMRSRLKLALALVGSPKILMLDEPTAALDSDGISLVRSLVSATCQRGGAVLMATNDRSDLEMASHELPLP